MANRWFRFYDEVLDDPKVQKLSPDDFKLWVNLLCLANRNGGRFGNVSETAFALRMSVDATSTLLSRFLHGGLLDRLQGGPDGWHHAPHGWDKRQYKSDSSTERVKRFRSVTRNVTVTPRARSESEADTDKKKTPISPLQGDSVFDQFWKAYPHKIGKGAACKAFSVASKKTDLETMLSAIGRYTKSKPSDRPWANPATWLNQERWADEFTAPKISNGFGKPLERSYVPPTSNGFHDTIVPLAERLTHEQAKQIIAETKAEFNRMPQ